MKRFIDLKIGIIGGGQLGKMIAQEAKKMGLFVTILDPTPNSPASQIADKQIISDFNNEEKIEELVNECDITTFEIEHINTEILKRLGKDGKNIFPTSRVLEIIKDKSRQKEFLNKFNIPTSRWKRVNDNGFIDKDLGFPVVQKACRGGYDGRGVYIIKNKDDIENRLKTESFLEEYIDFEKELAIMVARNRHGEIRCYPLVEMVFDKEENICDMIIAPARVDENIYKEASEIAAKCVRALNGIGVFGVEMFLTKDKKILVNEIAPRVHNSGHYTIEGCVTSQFEQHIRCIAGLPLGSTELIVPTVVMNILGEKNHYGTADYIGVNEALEIPGVSVHIYGKKEIKPYRKMGHVTIVDKQIEKAIEKAYRVKNVLKAISKEA
ncbi:5-(carboxyamino)imidazole ribonucleotide synthase [Paramaledivibacter caminithermalis]|uniref:N5-carboxyaminoimidazole ribonucleotide synthase n=1 Tax=Paramaledivibacter caminithermalis (strain DSM 15212 / CIP 107654 / DViRD3) TaxID=1121301 RepID=A0A1M6QJI6_PARC5|nr:5-(carboxyamino)imidazole ribonucleotide synthase [Paramaledivibacter caminithermalis]SHK20356.1 5-(carboxyamino)imidazole ribonucleotide synthase [Paramaledivibacter caminithermalis DSM 15212]